MRLQNLLMTPQRELHVELVITMDSGETGAFNAYRVQHDNSRGPFKGGFQFHPSSDLSTARRCGRSWCCTALVCAQGRSARCYVLGAMCYVLRIA